VLFAFFEKYVIVRTGAAGSAISNYIHEGNRMSAKQSQILLDKIKKRLKPEYKKVQCPLYLNAHREGIRI